MTGKRAAPREPEDRRSHASFRRTLERIADRIDKQPLTIAEWTWRPYYNTPQQSRIRVHALWVAGSFARGASTCGDLDLIADASVEAPGIDPGEAVMARAIVGRAPDVRLYIGTPDKNHSGIPFPEARLIWSKEDPDWRAALEAVRVDPGAARFARVADQLPLRGEQLGVAGGDDSPSVLTGLIDLKRDGVIDWRFVPSSSIETDETKWSPEARAFSERTLRFVGRKSGQAIREVVGLVQRDDRVVDWRRRHDDDRVTSHIGGAGAPTS
jgi:hypothetical protein